MTRKRRDRQAMKRALLLKLPDSLLHLLLHRLVRVHNCLLVNHDLRRVRPRTANPGRDRRWVGLDNDPVRKHQSPSACAKSKKRTKSVRDKDRTGARTHRLSSRPDRE